MRAVLKGGGAALDSVNLIVLADRKVGKIGTILSRYACDEGCFQGQILLEIRSLLGTKRELALDCFCQGLQVVRLTL